MARAGRAEQDRIRRIAAERFGAVDILVTRTHENVAGLSAPWYSLSIKLPGDDAWHFVGRRRLMVELVELVKTLDPAEIEGRSFV